MKKCPFNNFSECKKDCALFVDSKIATCALAFTAHDEIKKTEKKDSGILKRLNLKGKEHSRHPSEE